MSWFTLSPEQVAKQADACLEDDRDAVKPTDPLFKEASAKLTADEANAMYERAATVALKSVTGDQRARAYVNDKGSLVLEYHKA